MKEVKLVGTKTKVKDGGRCLDTLVLHPVFLSTMSVLLSGGRKVFEEQPSLSKLLSQRTCCATVLFFFFLPAAASLGGKKKKKEKTHCVTRFHISGQGCEGGALVGK